jgi:hypothetical protein
MKAVDPPSYRDVLLHPVHLLHFSNACFSIMSNSKRQLKESTSPADLPFVWLTNKKPCQSRPSKKARTASYNPTTSSLAATSSSNASKAFVDVIDLPDTPPPTLPALVYDLDQSVSTGHIRANRSELHHPQPDPIETSTWIDVTEPHLEQGLTETLTPLRSAKATKVRRRQARKVSGEMIHILYLLLIIYVQANAERFQRAQRFIYLDEDLRLEGRTHRDGDLCSQCPSQSTAQPIAYRCCTCVGCPEVCADCLLSLHRFQPFCRTQVCVFDRVLTCFNHISQKVWNVTKWQKVAVTGIHKDFAYQLGHDGGPCSSPNTATNTLIAVHTNGLHKICVRYCTCQPLEKW